MKKTCWFEGYLIGLLLLVMGGMVQGQEVVVRGQTEVICVTPTIDTGAYAAGDLMGGLLTLTGAMRPSESSSNLLEITVIDEADQSMKLTVWVCTNNLSNSTLTDQAALNIADADVTGCKAVTVEAYHYKDTAANAVATLGNLLVGFQGVTASQSALYAVLEAEDAPTYTAADDLTVCLTFLKD